MTRPRPLRRPARWRTGARVQWWTIASQHAGLVGTLVEPGRDGDLRQRVLWDGQAEPAWCTTATLWPAEWTVEQVRSVYAAGLPR